MMKCLIPLIYVASTLSPLASECPSFKLTETYSCRTYGPDGKLTDKPLVPLTIREGTVDGHPSYVIGSDRVAPQTLVIGSSTEQVVGGQTFVHTSSCELYDRSRSRPPRVSVVMRSAIKGGPVQRETFFYQDGGAAIQMEFVTGQNNGAPVSWRQCSPTHVTTPKR